MPHPILERVQLLISQNRFDEAENQIKTYLQEFPTDEYGQYLLAYIFYFKGEVKKSKETLLGLQQESPDNPNYIALLAEIDIKEESYQDAEIKTDLLLQMRPNDAEFFTLKAKLKYVQRYYDSALHYANEALALDPENIMALNYKTSIAGILGDAKVAEDTIIEALEQNPEDPTSIANHAHQLLRAGKVNESLDRFSEALRHNPTNTLARYGMQEAMKSKFWLYRLFFKYFEFMARLTANGSWIFVVGTYIAYQVLNRFSKTYPFLKPLVYIVLAFFILSWVINPLMNLYLMTNKYGRLLLDEDDKIMAKLTGVSLLTAILCFGVYFATGLDSRFAQTILMGGILFVAMMIPFGTFLLPYKKEQKDKLKYATIAILICGIIGLLVQNSMIISLSFLGVFAYQFLYNSISINSGSRQKE